MQLGRFQSPLLAPQALLAGHEAGGTFFLCKSPRNPASSGMGSEPAFLRRVSPSLGES